MLTTTLPRPVNQEELEAVCALLHALSQIKTQSGHGSVNLTIVDNQVNEIDIQSRIRPKIAAPWHPKTL